MIRVFTIAMVAFAIGAIGLQPAAADTPAPDPLAGVSAATQQQWAEGITWSEAPGTRGGVTPQVSVGGCGFLQNCLYFNHADQKAILAGGAAGIAGVICVVGSPAACVVAAVVVGVALSYLGDHGICSSNHKLRVRWFPAPGGAKCVS